MPFLKFTQIGGYIKIDGLENPKRELRRYRLPNPAYNQAVRAKRYVGNIPKFVDFAHIEDDALFIPVLCYKKYKPKSFPKVHFNHRATDLRPYQSVGLMEWIAKEYGILQMCAGGGKTVVGSEMIRSTGVKAMVVVPTKDIMQQWYRSAKEHSGFRFDRVGGGYAEGTTSSLAIVGTYQTLRNRVDLTMSRGLIIIDECHRTPCASISDIMGATAAQYRYGVTATPERADGLSEALKWLLGGVTAVVTREQMGGHIVDPTIKRIDTGNEYGFHGDPMGLQAAIAEDFKRNSLVAWQIVKNLDNQHSVLCLSNRVSQLHILENILRGFDIKVALIHGSTKKPVREKLLNAVRRGDIRVLLATYSLAGEGLDVPRLSCLVMGAPQSNKVRTEQSCGRIARPFKGKVPPLVVDFVDHCPSTHRMWKARCRVYNTLGYEIEGETHESRI